MRIRDKIDKKKVSHYLFNDEEIVCMNKKYFNDNYIHKDRIRDKIKELKKEKSYYEGFDNTVIYWELTGNIELLKDLIEEG